MSTLISLDKAWTQMQPILTRWNIFQDTSYSLFKYNGNVGALYLKVITTIAIVITSISRVPSSMFPLQASEYF